MFSKSPHLAVIEGVGVVAIASVLLVAVEAVIVGFVQEVGSGGGETLDSVGVLLVLVVLKISQEILIVRNMLHLFEPGKVFIAVTILSDTALRSLVNCVMCILC